MLKTKLLEQTSQNSPKSLNTSTPQSKLPPQFDNTNQFGQKYQDRDPLIEASMTKKVNNAPRRDDLGIDLDREDY